MFTRKSGAADSSVLSHPMLWLDERIFGWSRSAAVGQSVWGQPSGRERSRSQPSTAPASPAESDDEEYSDVDVDYDDVLAIIDTRKYTGPAPGGAEGYSAAAAGGAGADGADTGVPLSPRRRGQRGRSYRDLPRLDNANGDAEARSPDGLRAGKDLPSTSTTAGDEAIQKLTMRKSEKQKEQERKQAEAKGDKEKAE